MGVPVRLHLLLFLLIALIFGAEWNKYSANSNLFAGTAMVTVLVLLVSILIHELAHIFSLCNLGGHVNEIVLMPWGGDSDFGLPATGPTRAVVYLAGPFVNGAIFLLGTVLLTQNESTTLIELVNPFAPHWFNAADWQVSLARIVTWVNFQLMLVNMIPCYPFDGANIVRSLVCMINVDLPKYRVETAIKVMGHAVAFSFIGMAWIFRDYSAVSSLPIQPIWLLFLLFGITLFFSAQYSLSREIQSDETDWEDVEDMDYDSIYNESSIFDFSDDTENTAYSQWLTEKQDERREDQQRIEDEEDRRADEILKKLHGGSLSNLTEEERSVLDRVSARIRRRRQQGV
jgi:Zn-dependent protease